MRTAFPVSAASGNLHFTVFWGKTMPTTKAVKLQDLIDAGIDGQLRIVRRTLAAHGRTIRTVDELIEAFISFGTETIERATARSKPACKAGCYYCCHIPVSLSALEAIALARYLKKTLAPEDLSTMRAKIKEHLAWSERLTWDEHVSGKRICALLSAEGRCSVHAMRPMSCRWTNSFSAKQCEDAINKTSDGNIEADLQALMWGRAVALGLSAGLKEAGLDDKSYELHSALLRALETPDVETRWIREEPVFVGCKVTP